MPLLRRAEVRMTDRRREEARLTLLGSIFLSGLGGFEVMSLL